MEEKFLSRAVELAEDALKSGNQPFGSVLVDKDGHVLFEDHNGINTEHPLAHPEYAIAKWAASNMTPEDRRDAVVYTSGEHCPMCSTAHALVGLGKIVYASSSEQLGEWLQEFDAGPSAFKSKPVTEIILNVDVEGPFEPYSSEVRALHERYYNL